MEKENATTTHRVFAEAFRYPRLRSCLDGTHCGEGWWGPGAGRGARGEAQGREASPQPAARQEGAEGKHLFVNTYR